MKSVGVYTLVILMTVLMSERINGRSYMNVVISNNGDFEMCASCFSGTHDKDREGCALIGESKTLSWDFKAGASTRFWCTATYGTKYLRQFPVFGDGVPKKSSDWKIDKDGKIRTHEDGKSKNDNFGAWN